MSTVADVVVAGAGHNSLVTAAYLAKAGFEVLVLEERPVVGGTRHRGADAPGILHDPARRPTTSSRRARARGAAARRGLRPRVPPPTGRPRQFGDGESITGRDLDRTCEEFARFSARDAEAYRRLIADYDAVKGVFGAYRNNPVGRAPRPDEVLDATWRRRLAMSAWDVIRADFEDWHSQAFMLWMAFMTVQPCDRPGTGVLAYSLVYGRQQHSWTLPRGGSAALPLALARLVEDRGGSVVTGARVSGLVVEDGRCVGVETEGGETYRARRAVVSSVHVKHLVEMAPPDVWGEEFPVRRRSLARGRLPLPDALCDDRGP
jgi:phytoene dehydrogenase-like protein